VAISLTTSRVRPATIAANGSTDVCAANAAHRWPYGARPLRVDEPWAEERERQQRAEEHEGRGVAVTSRWASAQLATPPRNGWRAAAEGQRPGGVPMRRALASRRTFSGRAGGEGSDRRAAHGRRGRPGTVSAYLRRLWLAPR
jgi:hypothetical protein